ncbi:hypothetical protein Pyn_14547 [Prunus yedoensis var. nudiflora]|uniref:WAT1-related protein n=1 Tax=Prunus yedoensis var. nudiflora TaxID=2094558 RepID=A0A314YQH0_PRUYE|nr:hypothetical protein Pyn_14547 [Prunus yedoensis var. nudiflora]
MISSCDAQLLKFIGINYSSPTMASAMIDLMPTFTFILAVYHWDGNSRFENYQ